MECLGREVVDTEAVAMNTAGVKADSVIGDEGGVENSMAKEHAWQFVVAFEPVGRVRRIGIADIPVFKQVILGLVGERLLDVDATVYQQVLTDRDGQRQRRDILLCVVVKPGIGRAVDDLLLVVPPDRHHVLCRADTVDDGLAVRALSDEVADEQYEVVLGNRKFIKHPFEFVDAAVDITDDVDVRPVTRVNADVFFLDRGRELDGRQGIGG